MESGISVAIAAFLSPYLVKAGEKISEKIVETFFESRKDLAEKFTGLFKTEIISLDLNDSASINDITKRLEERPEVKDAISRKILNNQNLLDELIEEFKQTSLPEFEGININANKIAQVNINSQTVSQTIENF